MPPTTRHERSVPFLSEKAADLWVFEVIEAPVPVVRHGKAAGTGRANRWIHVGAHEHPTKRWINLSKALDQMRAVEEGADQIHPGRRIS